MIFKRKKIKRILVATNHLKTFGGSETYTFTLIKELVRRGVDVCFFANVLGEVSDEISKISTLVTLEELSTSSFDLALISHTSCAILEINAKKKIQICHGVFPQLEQPSPFVDGWIAISDEVRENINNIYPYNNITIQNPIDTKRFSRGEESVKLSKVLSLCQGYPANELLQEVCSVLNLELSIFNKYQKSVWEIEKEIQRSDLVISVGRGVLEAMSCGKSVIVFDNRDYIGESYMDGIIKPSNFDAFKTHNFSGRATKKVASRQDLINEFQKWSRNDCVINRNLIVKYNDVSVITDQILDFSSRIRFSFLRFNQKSRRKEISNFLTQFQHHYVQCDGDDSVWYIDNKFKIMIRSAEEMTERMMKENGNPDWIVDNVEKRIIDSIPNIS